MKAWLITKRAVLRKVLLAVKKFLYENEVYVRNFCFSCFLQGRIYKIYVKIWTIYDSEIVNINS